MRVQCDVCEKNKAAVMCCADEAALCSSCDTRVHAANKLANKHVRVPLVGQLESPKCDICQEKTGFFFCLEDRALLCRDCDVSIHTANKLSSNHQRFLITGTRVGLDAVCGQQSVELVAEDSPRAPVPKTLATPPPSKCPSPPSASKSSTVSANKPESAAANATPASTPSWLSNSGRNSERERTKTVGMTSANAFDQQGPLIGRRNIIPGDFLSDAVPVWGVDELLNLPELADGYHMGDIGSSKADMNNLGDYDWMADLSMFEEQMYAESLHEVPEMFAPAPAVALSRGGKPTALSKGKAKQDAAIVPQFDDTFIVPDLGLPTSPAPVAKRRRTLNESL
jgi:uncharacterized protein (DUF1330 family)